MSTDTPLATDAIGLVRTELRRLGDPERAKQMAPYIKNRSLFYEVAKPGSTPVYRALVAGFPIETAAQYTHLISALWAEPEGEPKYRALRLARRWSQFHALPQLPLFTLMIAQGA